MVVPVLMMSCQVSEHRAREAMLEVAAGYTALAIRRGTPPMAFSELFSHNASQETSRAARSECRHRRPGHTDLGTRAPTTQPQDGSGDFFRFAKAPNWLGSHKGLDDVGIAVLGDPDCHLYVAVDPWAFGIGPDPPAGIVKSRCPREAQ